VACLSSQRGSTLAQGDKRKYPTLIIAKGGTLKTNSNLWVRWVT
jgi:hypothetical protein